MKIGQILRLTLFLPLIYYLYISINYDNNVGIRESQKNKYVSEKFKVDKVGDLIFNISSKEWPFKDRLGNELLLLSINFDDNIDVTQSKLIFKINAYAKNKDKVLNRLILHEYVNDSDETILKDFDMSGGRYRLGLLSNFSYEDMTIRMNIIQSDSLLNKANPRLEIESYKGSSEVYGFAGLGVLINNFILIVSILCLIIFVIIGYRNEIKK
jgi:hypothetical protein